MSERKKQAWALCFLSDRVTLDMQSKQHVESWYSNLKLIASSQIPLEPLVSTITTILISFWHVEWQMKARKISTKQLSELSIIAEFFNLGM